jgi:hypothetical protein
MPSTLLPRSLGVPRLVRWLNVAAVGFALAACTGAAFGTSSFGWEIGTVCALSTLFYGLCWSCLMRVGFLGKWGWIAATPLALANSATAYASLAALDRDTLRKLDLLLFPSKPLLEAIVVGSMFGAVIWIPALIMTLLGLGLPVSIAQRAAARGLAGEDRAEQAIGFLAAGYSGLGLLVCMAAAFAHPSLAGLKGVGVVLALALAGLATGLASVQLAHVRGWGRRTFFRTVRAGDAPEYRFDREGGAVVLVRVTETGQGYRAATTTEPLALIEDTGDAKRIGDRTG